MAQLYIVTLSLILYMIDGFSTSPKLPDGFSYITDVDPSIQIQARYAIP